MTAEKFNIGYRNNQLRLAINKSHCLPNYIVSINSKHLRSMATTFKGITGFYDFIATCFRGYIILLSLHFGIIGVLVVKNRNFSKISFAHQDHGEIWT